MSELQFHPLADIFPLMEGAEFDALVADIKANGLRQRIGLYQGMILDGRNRYRACMALNSFTHRGHTLRLGGCGFDPLAYVISANIHRRHLTAEQKRELIAKLIAAAPEKPDLQIAKTTKTSPTTVGKVRRKLEAKGDVSTMETRPDTKGRAQPAKKERKFHLYRHPVTGKTKMAKAAWSPWVRVKDADSESVKAIYDGPMDVTEPTYQQTLYDQACRFLKVMTDKTLDRFYPQLVKEMERRRWAAAPASSAEAMKGRHFEKGI